MNNFIVKKSTLKFVLPVMTAGLMITALATNVFAVIDSKTASQFSQFCAADPSSCNKVDFNGSVKTRTVSCPEINQTVSNVYVHAGDGQIVYRLPNDGFSFTNNGDNATVSITTHPHDFSWIAVVCSPVQTPSPTPTPSATPTVTPKPSVSPSPKPTPSPKPSTTPCPSPSPKPSPKVSATPSPSPTPSQTPGPSVSPTTSPSPTVTPIPTPSPAVTPSPSPATGGDTNVNNNSNNQSQDQDNNQTVNINVSNSGSVQGASTITESPETGVSVLGMASMFGAAPFGFILSRYGKGRIAKKKEDQSDSFIES